MCSVLAGLTALGGVMQYQQQQAQADAQAKAYEAQAQQEYQNAKTEGFRQEQIADKYARESEDLRRRNRIIAGQTRAQAGAAGLGMAGSPLDILEAGNEAYNEDKMTLLSNQRNENYNSRVTQSNYIARGNSYATAAENTRSAAKWQGVATILGTAASIYGMGGFGGGASKAASSTSYSAGKSGSGWTIGGQSDFLTSAPSATYSNFNIPTSISGAVGSNTMSNWTVNKGYTFTPQKSLNGWNRKKTYF